MVVLSAYMRISMVHMLPGQAVAAGCVRLLTGGATDLRVAHRLENGMPGSKLSTCTRPTLSFSSPGP